MSTHLQATLIPGQPSSVFFWMSPGSDEPLDEALSVVGAPGLVAAEHRLTWPSVWVDQAETVTAKSGVVRREVGGVQAPIGSLLGALAAIPVDARGELSTSLAAWSLAAKLAVEMVANQRIIPWIDSKSEETIARWCVAMGPEDRHRFDRLAVALPPVARSANEDYSTIAGAFLDPAVALRTFLDEAADSLVRAGSKRARGRGENWSSRVASALVDEVGDLEIRPVVDASLIEAVQRWAGSVVQADEMGTRLELRLEAPDSDDGLWKVHLAMASCIDPSLRVGAGEIWKNSTAEIFPGVEPAGLRLSLLHELGRAVRVWPRLAEGLSGRPEVIQLESADVVELVREASALLRAAGIEIRIPVELTSAGRKRLRARLQARTRGADSNGRSSFNLDSIADVRWEALLDDQALEPADLDRLAALKQPLVRLRGQWVLFDRNELENIARRVREGHWQIEGAAALAAALDGDELLCLDSTDALAHLRQSLLAPPPDLGDIESFQGELRSYQREGFAWLERLDGAGFGGVLADDMGLGKTIQVLAFLACRADRRPPARAHLLVCPTSVLGGWEREAARFAPTLEVYRHYGRERAGSSTELAVAMKPGTLCLTTYSVLRKDRALLTKPEWETVILDEAQAIKNSTSRVFKVACTLKAVARFALTGTPVENRLSELWSIFRFVVPGLLGSEKAFRKKIAVPVERYRSAPALERLHRLSGPFLLRRTKTDPGVLPDLPPKLIVRARCPLTTEQATLYRAAVDEAMDEIQSSDGIERRGRVLSLITSLKQVCNHPAHFLQDSGELASRSGKLDRLGDELEEVLSAGEAALVFTQYRVMGELLLRFLQERLSLRAPFLHGGVTQPAREGMVERFQRADGPPVMVVSLRAGGTGLTLTRASHIFHFDRWWNPAVEDQASDRAHRIGQSKTVVVHPMICRGTMEERIDELMIRKAELASLALGPRDAFLTELDDAQLEALVRFDGVIEDTQ